MQNQLEVEMVESQRCEKAKCHVLLSVGNRAHCALHNECGSGHGHDVLVHDEHLVSGCGGDVWKGDVNECGAARWRVVDCVRGCVHSG